MNSFVSSEEATHFPQIRRSELTTLQVNLGYRCNQQCFHCHVEAGPHRVEMMEQPVVNQIIDFVSSSFIQTVDLTGGAPEGNPYFKMLVHSLREMGTHVIDRCNLTILEEPRQEGMMEFLADHQVEIIASLPCYLKENVDYQRGPGTFDRSIRILQRLNQLGYGKEGTGLVLNLVYNPIGPFLSPSQRSLEEDYRRELRERYGIFFNRLYTLQNMPIGRFKKWLESEGQLENYRTLLKVNHREVNLAQVMCRSLISVDWRGYIYDCDFNQILGIPLHLGDKKPLRVKDLKRVDLKGVPVQVSDYCFGCTSGQGSSCQGALN